MKLIAFFMIIGCLQLSAAGISQTVTINVENTTLEKVLEIVEQQTGYMFFYEKKLVQNIKPVTISVKNKPVQDFLYELLKGFPLEFAIRSTTITINAKRVDLQTATPHENLPVDQLSLRMKVQGTVVGLNNTPLHGATIRNLSTGVSVVSDNNGKFVISAEMGNTLSISFVGYMPKAWIVNDSKAVINLATAENKMEEVEVVINTGYQKVKANEMVGAVEVIDQKMLQQRASANILDRLRGTSSSLQFLAGKYNAVSTNNNTKKSLNMTVRGWSTIYGPTDPLIIVDEFPYEGDIDNINPNDVESIAILKDAAAASVWGARASNGVIVITTKRGRYNQKTSISFGTDLNIAEKPRLNKLPLLSTASYIDLETRLIGAKGLNNYEFQAITPVMEIMKSRALDLISASDSAARVDKLKTIDSRNEWNKHIYVNPLSQNYLLNLSGGSQSIAWNASGSFFQSRDNTQGLNKRATLSFSNEFKVIKNLEAKVSINYSNGSNKSGAPGFNMVRVKEVTDRAIPYLQLADENNKPVPFLQKFNQKVVDTLGDGMLLDYSYYPLNDWRHDYVKSELAMYSITGNITYRPHKDFLVKFSARTQKQISETKDIKDLESFYARDLINSYTRIDRDNRMADRLIPLGGIQFVNDNNMNSSNLRFESNYNKSINSRSRISALVVLDIGKTITNSNSQIYLGYNESPLYSQFVDMNSVYPQMAFINTSFPLYYNIDGKNKIAQKKLESRSVAFTSTLTYILNNKYILYSSLRREGANVFGVKTNDKWQPLWSAGVSWPLHKENFFRISWMNELTVNATIGITGNVDPSRTANPIATINPATPFPYLSVQVPPNPNLRWEKTNKINLRINTAFLENRIKMEFQYFDERGRDLYAKVPVDFTQSPATQIQGNASSMNKKGFDLRIVTRNIEGSDFSWNTTLSWSRTKSKVINNYYLLNSQALMNSLGNGTSIMENTIIYPGQEPFGISAIRSAGLSETGELQYLVKGKITTNLNEVQKEMEMLGKDATSYKYFGPSVPSFNGLMVNNFRWRQFSMMVSTDLRFNYYFARSTIKAGFLSMNSYHKDFDRRWQNPGDEKNTFIPAINFASPYESELAYGNIKNLTDVIYRGDHIRMDNVQFGYLYIPKKMSAALKSVNVLCNIYNLGVIWRANKEGLDPDYQQHDPGYTLPDRRISLSVSATF